MSLSALIKRILLYVGLAVAFLLAFALVFALSVRTGVVFPGRWVALVMWTAIIFAVLVRRRHEYWGRVKFWLAIGGMLVVHALAFTAVMKSYPEWRPIWFAPTSIVEAGLLGMLLNSLFRGESD